jgi:hypothetical protein
MLMRLITLISAMTLIHQNNYSELEEDTTTHLITTQNKNQESQELISKRMFLMMLKMFLPSLEKSAVKEESELVNSSEILINLDLDISLKLNSELVLIWEELF